MEGGNLASADEVTICMSKDMENFVEFSHSTEKLSSILAELKEDKVMETGPIRKAVESLEAEMGRAKALLSSPNYRSSPNKRMEDVIENLGRSIGLVLFASHDVPVAGKEKLEALRREMMNVARCSTASSDSKSEFVDDGETGEETEETEDEVVLGEIVEEEDGSNLSVEDVVLRLKCGNDEQLKLALSAFYSLVRDNKASSQLIDDERIIPILFNRLSSSYPLNRLSIIQILTSLIEQNDGIKEKMVEVEYLSILVKSLAQEEEERRNAVGLLLTISDVSNARRRMGRIQGSIVALVSIFNGEDQIASHDAGKLLNTLSRNTQNALHMAEAGYFKPLINYLNEGSDMSKILMATALSRMELGDETKASVGEDGAVPPLVKMFKEGKLEAKLSSLSALQNLSTLKENIQRLINSGIVPSLLQLLFSVTSVLMTLREPASAILSRIAQSDSILVNHDVALQMLSLLNLSSPIIQCHLLEALNSIASHSSASKVRRKMKENGSIQLLLPFLTGTNSKIRTFGLNLIFTLSKELSNGLFDQLGETNVNVIINIISSSSTSESEKAAAAGILSNLPLSDKKATDMLKKANLLPTLVSVLSSQQGSPTTPASLSLAENISGILIRFTVSSDRKLQLYSAEHGAIPVLVKLLTSGSVIAKSQAATSLAQFSQNTLILRKSRSSRWLCIPPTLESFCEVHNGHCFVKTTFCLVKAGAVSPLISALKSNEREADEAMLTALTTLLQDDIWENGSNCIEKMSGVEAILKVLESGSLKAQEKAVWMLERIFSIEDHRAKYREPAQMVLTDLAQNGNSQLKPAVARLLAQLDLSQVQCTY